MAQQEEPKYGVTDTAGGVVVVDGAGARKIEVSYDGTHLRIG